MSHFVIPDAVCDDISPIHCNNVISHVIFWFKGKLITLLRYFHNDYDKERIYGAKYSRMDQVKFVEDSWKTWIFCPI